MLLGSGVVCRRTFCWIGSRMGLIYLMSLLWDLDLDFLSFSPGLECAACILHYMRTGCFVLADWLLLDPRNWL